jgi:hypothetical protein
MGSVYEGSVLSRQELVLLAKYQLQGSFRVMSAGQLDRGADKHAADVIAATSPPNSNEASSAGVRLAIMTTSNTMLQQLQTSTKLPCKPPRLHTP